jgi:hypothetical protein
MFKVPLSQIVSHPKQRLIDLSWVATLQQTFELGVDKAVYPIQGTVAKGDEQELHKLWESHGKIPSIPEGYCIEVFDGQHRLQAYKKMAIDEEDMFWFAKVYSKRMFQKIGLQRLMLYQGLELDHPAEFLTMIHGANEQVVKKPTQDADRFLAIAELHTLFAQGKISAQQFQVSKARLQGNNESTSRGINNLIRHGKLREAVINALCHPYLRVHFKASSWRKLTTGHFYEARSYTIPKASKDSNIHMIGCRQSGE